MFTSFPLLNPTDIAVNEVCFQFSISRLVPETLAVKVESCVKSHKFLDVFVLPNFEEAVTPKRCTLVIMPTL